MGGNNSKQTNPREVALLQSKNKNKSRDFEVVTRGFYFKRMYFPNFLTVFIHIKFELFSSKSARNVRGLKFLIMSKTNLCQISLLNPLI